MINMDKKELYFPHIINTNVLAGVKRGLNAINGGFFPLANFNLRRNEFYGGLVEKFGLMKEYGFYACPHYEYQDKIVGFFIYDPSILTELGKQTIQNHYPDLKIVYEQLTVSPDRKMTNEEMEKKSELISKALEKGASQAEVSSGTVDELDALLRSMDSGKSNVKVGFEDAVPKPTKATTTVR